MIVGCIADVHVGNHRRFGGTKNAGINRRCHLACRVLATAFSEAYHHFAEEMWVAGDLFHVDDPTPQVVARVQRAMGLDRDSHMIDTHLVVGNHDMTSSASSDHAMASMSSLVAVHEQPCVISRSGYDVVAIPCMPGDAAKWLPEWLDELDCPTSVPRLMVVHLGVEDEETPWYLCGARDSVPVEVLAEYARKLGCSAVFAGNWHSPRGWDIDGVQIRQVGALCPTGFSNAGGDYGAVCFWDSETGRIRDDLEVRIEGPRFYTVALDDLTAKRSEMLLDPGVWGRSGDSVFVEVTASLDRMAEASELLKELRSSGAIVDGDVVPDAASLRASRDLAVHAALATSSHDEALAVFVDAIELPERVERRRVLDLSRAYLRGFAEEHHS